MNTLSTHVLDTSLGRPAPGIRIVLERLGSNDGRDPVLVGAGTTDDSGRLSGLLSGADSLISGVYRLRFDVADYFERSGRASFFPEVAVTFVVGASDEHYHIPLLLNPFGYTTYRGS